MTDSGSVHWEAFHLSVFGRERTAVRFTWADRPSTVRGCEAIVLRLRLAGGLTAIGAYIIAGSDGVPCPELPDEIYLIPGPTAVATFYVLLDQPAGAGHGFEAYVSFVRDSRNGAPTEKLLEIDLSDAWPQSPHDLSAEVATLRRLHGTGGTPSARAAYRRRAMEVLAQSRELRINEIRALLRKPGTASVMSVDMQPLCYANEIMEIARLADEGDVAAVSAGVEELPPELRQNSDVLGLVEHAGEIAAHPEDADKRSLQKAVNARAQGQLETAIEWAQKVRADGKYAQEARMVHLESAADIIEAALHNHDLARAKKWFGSERRAFEAEIGPDDPWLQSIQRAIASGGRVSPSSNEEIPIAELDDEESEIWPPFTMWSRMREWFKKVT